MKTKTSIISTSVALGCLASAYAQRPAVVVGVENTAPYNGTFLTPVWVGFHNGQFDSYDGGTTADTLPIDGSDALERLAEDGNTAPISADFETLVPGGAQTTIRSNGPIPPIGPGQIVNRLLEVDPSAARYFSYASMVIPSNDTFIANGPPKAHEVFDTDGNFVGQDFFVDGANDAATEVNDELPFTTAFFGQAAPNTGVDENGLIFNSTGFNALGTGGILDSSRFMDADYTQPSYDFARFTLTYIDKAAPVLFTANADATLEIPTPTVEGNPTARAFFFLDDEGDSLVYFAFANQLSGDLTAAHLHLAPALQTGPVTLPLNILFGRFVFGSIEVTDVVGPLAGEDALDNVIAEMVGGVTYVNFHTAANPAGEIRGQVHLNNF